MVNESVDFNTMKEFLGATDGNLASHIKALEADEFIAVEKRQALLEKIYAGLNPGGCLVISEKLLFEPEPLNTLLSELHHQFKRAQGYSDLEISQKRDSIENVLIPETLDAHIQRIKACGFNSASPWFQCFNFASLVAVK